MVEFLTVIKDMSTDFFATHGNELLVIVFKLAYYHCDNVLGENLPTETLEGKINQLVHEVLTKLITTEKTEDQH